MKQACDTTVNRTEAMIGWEGSDHQEAQVSDNSGRRKPTGTKHAYCKFKEEKPSETETAYPP